MSEQTAQVSHTPGPWTPVSGNGVHYRDVYIRAGERQADGSWPAVAKCCSTRIGGMVVVNANARLIACAPELLSALRGLRAVIHDYITHADNRSASEYIKAADSVIAKAEGGAE